MYVIESSGRRIHLIREVLTDKIVYTGQYYRETKKICRGLNSGNGFNGNTPDFFCIWDIQTNKKDGQ